MTLLQCQCVACVMTSGVPRQFKVDTDHMTLLQCECVACDMTSGVPRQFKVVLLGEGCVGKTSLVLRYCQNTFNDNHLSTLQVVHLLYLYLYRFCYANIRRLLLSQNMLEIILNYFKSLQLSKKTKNIQYLKFFCSGISCEYIIIYI